MSAITRRTVIVIFLFAVFLTRPSAQTTTLTGYLALTWGDPLTPGVADRFSIDLFVGDGPPVNLQFAEDARPSWEQLRRFDRQLVRVSGVGGGADAAVTGSVFRVTGIELAEPSPQGVPGGDALQAPKALLTGAQPWVTLLCRFSDVVATPAVNTTLLSGTGYPTLDEFWRETSYENINLTGSGVAPWVTMANPRSYYITGGNADLIRLAADCTAASDPFINFNSYVGINMLFNDSIGNFYWGTSGQFMTLDGASRLWRMTWLDLRQGVPLAALGHEMGHGFFLPHSSGPYGATYDSFWDVMSYPYVNYNFGIQTYIPEGTISYHKDLDGWIPAARKFTAVRNTSTTITLDRLVAPPSVGAYLMAQIPIPGTTTRFYTVELRHKIGHDAPLPGTAVIIHSVQTNRGSPAQVVDADGNGNPNDEGAMWRPGETFTDAANAISVAIVSVTDSAATVVITAGYPSRRLGDYTGDGRADLAVFRPSTGAWYVRGLADATWGGAGDIPVTGDFDGDGRADIAVFRPSDGGWYIALSSGGSVLYTWGGVGDIPVPGDYDADGRTDIAVFRRSTSLWYIYRVGTGTMMTQSWGGGSDIPVQADYDGDGITDIAIFRPSTGIWYILRSTGGSAQYLWGGGTDVTVPGDYDGDGRADVAVFRPSTGVWHLLNITAGTSSQYSWGGPGDTPVPGDYDGDRRTDIAVFRPSTGIWYIVPSTTLLGETYAWGSDGDLPILRR